jgi:phosphoglycerate dehydrogenase-like enzyme
MTTIVVGSVLLPEIAEHLRRDLPGIEVRELDLPRRGSATPLGDDARAALAAARAIVPVRGYVGVQVLDAAADCMLIQQFGVGVDNVDRDEADRRGIPVCNVPSGIGGNAESVAEMALLHLIGAGRGLARLQRQVAAEDFSAQPGRSLFGATVCIVGFGSIGQALARLLGPFRCRIVGIRRTTAGPSVAGVELWPSDRLHDALAVADFVVVCLPLDATTESFIGPAEFAAMRDGTRIVNISRGPTIDRDALLDALRTGRIAAAGLDVFWEEPITASDPILGENVAATPHCAGLTDHMMAGTSRAVADNIRRVLDGQEPLYRVGR